MIPGPPGKVDVPSMAKPAGFAVNTWPPTVNTSRSWYLFVLMTRSEGLSDTGVPDVMTPGPPAEMLVPAIEKSVGLAVNDWPPTTKTDGVDARGMVLDLTIRPEGPKNATVPDMVTAGPPS